MKFVPFDFAQDRLRQAQDERFVIVVRGELVEPRTTF
jgi:hypothetical protein